MNLKYRFAFLFSFFVFIFLMVSFAAVYYLLENFRKDDFIFRLRTNAKNEYRIFSSSSTDSINPIKETFPIATASEGIVVILDSLRRVLYSNPASSKLNITANLVAKAKKKGEAVFKQGNNDGVVISLNNKNKKVFVAASAYDEYGVSRMNKLRNILLVSLAGGLILSGMFAFFFAKQALQPLNELNDQVQGITENNLDARINVPGKDGEIGRIAKSFNSMLNRLQKSFEMQKNFVQHASHELRTPLANMLSQTEAALRKDLPKEELEKVLHSLREDQVNLTELTNSLLLLSQFESLSLGKQFLPVRIDEILYETIETFKEKFPAASINLDFATVPESSGDLTIKGDEALIRTAIQNLVKNAFIYSSDDKVAITIGAGEQGVDIVFENAGQQLTSKEQNNLFVPFYRGENSMKVKGTGMGLALVERIAKLHNGTIVYKAMNGSINRFTLSIKKSHN